MRHSLCRHEKCEAPVIINGLCCSHYLEALDKFEAQSRKSKIVVGRISKKNNNSYKLTS